MNIHNTFTTILKFLEGKFFGVLATHVILLNGSRIYRSANMKFTSLKENRSSRFEKLTKSEKFNSKIREIFFPVSSQSDLAESQLHYKVQAFYNVLFSNNSTLMQKWTNPFAKSSTPKSYFVNTNFPDSENHKMDIFSEKLIRKMWYVCNVSSNPV